jgi:ABC-type dipeptide/oligopeptide/nickel transport system permease component
VRNYIVKRLLLSIPTIIGAITIVFFAIRLAPGDPAVLFVPPDLQGADAAAWLEKINEKYGFNDPLPVQYARYIQNTLALDFGSSLRTKRPVIDDLARRLPNTLQLGLAGFVLSVVVGIPIGIIAAVKRATFLDGALMVFGLAGVSIPSFWFAYMLMLLFSLQLDLLPPSGMGGPEHMVMPVIVLGLTTAGALARYTRSSLLEVINHDYVRTARAKGLSESKVILSHALRNGLIPIVTLLGINLGFVLSGSVIVETVFAWPGIGSYLVDGIDGRDFPVVQATVLVIAAGFILGNILTDLMLVYVDPRIRFE